MMKKLYFSLIVPLLLAYAINGRANPIGDRASDAIVIPLTGEWQLTGYSPDRSKQITLKAQVPGQVHVDLIREGIIEDPFWRDNAEKCQWVENWEWRYKKSFRLPENFDECWTKLQFDGLDTFADVYLNGRKIGDFSELSAKDMFLPYEYDIKGWLKLTGENVIEVRFFPLEKIVGEQAKQHVYPVAFGDPIRSYVRRMQCTFGWDWVNRFVTMGIWKDCRIVNYRNARVDNGFFYTKSLGKNVANTVIEVATSSDDSLKRKLVVKLYDPDNKQIWSAKTDVRGGATSRFEIPIANPQLWWPNGAGAQPIYKFVAEVYSDNKLVNSKSYQGGIRTVAIEELRDKDRTDGSSFTIVVNGKRIFAKGGNWIPADPFPARISAEKYNYLITQSSDAGMNMLRVWGGGIFEPEAFWAACDREGIMVWQDFLLACGGYPQTDPAFVELFRKEIEANVKLLRNHPSLVIWCGDNELSLNHTPDSNWPYKEIHQKVTVPMMAEIDPSRPFRLSSPLGIDPSTTNSSVSGDAHKGGQYMNEMIESVDGADYRLITGNTARSRFLSESTTAGAPPKRTLLRFMTEEDLANCEMFDYHTKDNPYEKGGLTLFGKMESLTRKLYGNPGEDVDRRLRQLEYVQYDFVRQSMEAARANKYYSSGILFWMYNDCWPASGWSLVDYWGGRKASWYAMRNGCAPVIASTQQIGDKLQWAIASDDINRPMQVGYVVKIQSLGSDNSKVLKSGVASVAVDGAVKVLEMNVSKVAAMLGDDKMAVLEISRDGKVVDRSFWTNRLPKDVKYATTKLTVKCTGLGTTSGTVTISSDKWARVVTLDADADFDDNYFELLPGESRTIAWKTSKPIEKIDVNSWNSK